MLALALAQTIVDTPATTAAEDLGRKVAFLLGKNTTCVVGVSEILGAVSGEERENVIIHAIAQGANTLAIEGCLKQMEQQKAVSVSQPISKQRSFWIGIMVGAAVGAVTAAGTGVYLLRRRRT